MKKILLILLCVSLIFCGCTKPVDAIGKSEQVNLTTTAVSAGSDIADTAAATTADEPQPYPVTLNGTELTESPQRVISLSPSLTEIICEMGYTDRLVARSAYCDYPPEITALSDLGSSSDPNIDTIIVLKPDIVFTSTTIASKDVFTLEKEGIKVIHIPAPKTLDNLKLIYQLIGYAFEGLFDGESKGSEYFAPIQSAYDGINKSGEMRFAYITENMTVATSDTLECAILSAFGTSVTGNAENYSFDKTFMTEMQPDIIFLNSVYTVEQLAADEFYGTLDAVKNGKVVLVDNSYFERPSARLVKLIEEISAETEKIQ